MIEKRILGLVFVSILLLLSCSSRAVVEDDENWLDDPIETYSIIKEDSSGIDIVSLSDNNPLAIRKMIARYEIPEKTLAEKEKVLYAMLDTLQALSSMEHENIYNCVDSLNYMVVHYMQSILSDRKTIYAPLKHKLLKVVSSADKSMNIYSWNENIGVGIASNMNVIQYLTQDKALKVQFCGFLPDSLKNNFTIGVPVSIYKLNHKNDGNLYLVNMEGAVSKKSYYKGSAVLQVLNDSLIFDYECFESGEKNYIMLHPAEVDVACSFNYKTNQLTYRVKEQSKVTTQVVYVFNGEQFVLKQD